MASGRRGSTSSRSHVHVHGRAARRCRVSRRLRSRRGRVAPRHDGARPDVAGRRAHQHLVAARVRAPRVRVDVPVAEGVGTQSTRTVSRLPGSTLTFANPTSSRSGRRTRLLRRPHVDLDHLGAAPRPVVGQGDADPLRVGARCRRRRCRRRRGRSRKGSAAPGGSSRRSGSRRGRPPRRPPCPRCPDTDRPPRPVRPVRPRRWRGTSPAAVPTARHAPTSMSASASAPSSPGYHVMSNAPARSAHGRSTGEPALTTTTVRAVDLQDRLDELALPAGQREVGPVVSLGLPLPVRADHDHGDVRLGGGARPPARTRRPCPAGMRPIRAPMMGEDDERGQISTTRS